MANLKKKLLFIYPLINFFYFNNLFRFFLRKIANNSPETQYFFIGRKDLGTHLYMIHYLKLWSCNRGKASLILLTNERDNIIRLAKIIIPDVSLVYPSRLLDRCISAIFGPNYVFSKTLLPLYGLLSAMRPDFLHMFDLAESPYAKYNAFLDSNLFNSSCSQLSKLFVDTYKVTRKTFDCQCDVISDYYKLNYKTIDSEINTSVFFKNIKKNLKIKDKFVVLNVNTKKYSGPSNRRTICFPDRYNSIIDALIEKGYDVVLQGRNEQPHFKARKGFIDYSRSSICQVENDLALYQGAAFAIASKSGAEIFSTICNTPVLGLNYTEILDVQPAKKLRFYPKFLYDKKNSLIMSWKMHLNSSHFFDIGGNIYGDEIEYIEMSEEDMIAALNEFLPLVSSPLEEWESYTAKQLEFRKELTPLHMQLYLTKGVPCEAFLKKAEFALTSHKGI